MDGCREKGWDRWLQGEGMGWMTVGRMDAVDCLLQGEGIRWIAAG